MRSLEPGFAESLSGIWSALHNHSELTIRESEVHYLQMLALAADDDLVSHLLLKKLRIATVTGAPSAPERLVAMNSFLEYRFDRAQKRFCQLVHPSAYAPNYGVSVVSLIGAGLIGLRAGQSILWPNEAGTLCDLEVVHVENCPGLNDWLGSVPVVGAARG